MIIQKTISGAYINIEHAREFRVDPIMQQKEDAQVTVGYKVVAVSLGVNEWIGHVFTEIMQSEELSLEAAKERADQFLADLLGVKKCESCV